MQKVGKIRSFQNVLGEKNSFGFQKIINMKLVKKSLFGKKHSYLNILKTKNKFQTKLFEILKIFKIFEQVQKVCMKKCSENHNMMGVIFGNKTA